MMYEVRRGGENLDTLEASDFKVFDDTLYDFKYVRKTVSEKEKAAPLGSNSMCHGVIPFLDLADGFNPGEYFDWYLTLLPKEPNKKDNKRYLFPKPRQVSNKFNPHDAEARLFEPNMKGKF